MSVLAYLRAAGAGTYLDIGLCPWAPALVLSVGSPGSHQLDDEEGAEPVPAGELCPVDSGPDPGGFCVKHRRDWLSYAMTWTRSWPDAEDAVSDVVQKIFEHHDKHGTLCPDMRDPVGWSKTVIRNYLIDRYRRTQALHTRGCMGERGPAPPR
jgi:Sigma-70 region 2